jgi:hypothetical protein
VDIYLSSTSAFMSGIAHETFVLPAYTVGKITDSTDAFLGGRVLNVSSVSAFISSGQYISLSNQPCYLIGVKRNSIPCYLRGITVRSKYIWLTTSDQSLSKRFMVLQQDYDGGTESKQEEIIKTISGGIEHSIGAVSTQWRMIVRVRNWDDDTNGNLSDLEHFFSLNNPNGTPSNLLTFVDHYGYEHKVIMLGNMKKNLVATVIEGPDALYLYRLELICSV